MHTHIALTPDDVKVDRAGLVTLVFEDEAVTGGTSKKPGGPRTPIRGHGTVTAMLFTKHAAKLAGDILAALPAELRTEVLDAALAQDAVEAEPAAKPGWWCATCHGERAVATWVADASGHPGRGAWGRKDCPQCVGAPA